MSHKTELRNYLSAAGDEKFSDWSEDSPFRQIDHAKNKLDNALNKARDLFKFLDDTCEIVGLDVTRAAAATQIKIVTDELDAAKTDVAALSFPALGDHWPSDKAAVSNLTDYVEPEAPADPALEAAPAAEEAAEEDAAEGEDAAE